MRASIIILLFVFTHIRVAAQVSDIVADKPRVGYPLPYFELTNVHYYKSSKVTSSDFRGKWLIMDFWFTSCGTCIKSFPKMNSLQARFKDDVQFLLIGLNKKTRFYRGGIEELYEKFRKGQKLELASAYDSTLHARWEVNAMPYLVAVDPEGVVRWITTSEDMTTENVQKLLDNRELPPSITEAGPPIFSADSVFGRSPFLLYRSVLAKWNGEQQSIPDIPYYVKYGRTPGFQVTRVALEALYNIAYFGRSSWPRRTDTSYHTVYPRPVIETADKERFAYDYKTGKGIYNYELIIPQDRNNEKTVMKIMQRELHAFFGFDVSIETRMMPVWLLVATPAARKQLLTKGGYSSLDDPAASSGAAGFTLRNCSVSIFIQLVTNFINENALPVFDETGIPGNIDITIDALLTDREGVIRELNRNGLELMEGKKPMTVLVVRDSD